MTEDLLRGFRETYGQAREAFLAAAAEATSVSSFVNSRYGPAGEELATDIAWFGDPDAEKVLVIVSGTHGIEGLCGAACQLNWMTSGAPNELPAGVAVLLIHLINPYGVAWEQRGTEEGIDLNRNYVDHGTNYRQTPRYDELHEALMCSERTGPAREAAQKAIADFRERHAQDIFAQTIFGGQYTHPDGMNYGGRAPAWSNRTLVSIAHIWLAKARHIVLLDYHTGLGPFGHASLILFCNPGDPLHRRACEWFGHGTLPVGGPDVLPPLGHTGEGLAKALPSTFLTPVTVEFGTLDVETECQVVIDDLWLRNFGDRGSPEGRQIKQALRDHFYPTSPDWRELIALRSRQVIAAAIAGLDREESGGH